MRRLLLLSIIPWLLAADDHWVKFTRGPLEVMTDAGARVGRETMVRFEQFRAALGQIVGEDDLQTPLPLRIFVFKNARGWTSAAPLTEGRDHFCIVLGEKSAVTPEIYSALTGLFLKSNTAQMPPAFERGLIAFFSTFEVTGIRITAGKPPAQPDLDWARIHLMVVDPDYYGKIRVLLYNLRHGVADDPAYRNAFGKSAAEVEAAAKQHFAAGNFQTTRLPSRPMAEGDFPERQGSGGGNWGEGAGRNLPGRPQLRPGRQSLAQRRAGGHRPRRARPHAPGAHDYRAAAPGLRGRREAPRSRGEGARDRPLEDRGARRTAQGRSQIQRRNARGRRQARAE